MHFNSLKELKELVQSCPRGRDWTELEWRTALWPALVLKRVSCVRPMQPTSNGGDLYAGEPHIDDALDKNKHSGWRAQ
jgi:hypothetical protein